MPGHHAAFPTAASEQPVRGAVTLIRAMPVAQHRCLLCRHVRLDCLSGFPTGVPLSDHRCSSQ